MSIRIVCLSWQSLLLLHFVSSGQSPLLEYWQGHCRHVPRSDFNSTGIVITVTIWVHIAVINQIQDAFVFWNKVIIRLFEVSQPSGFMVKLPRSKLCLVEYCKFIRLLKCRYGRML